MCGGASSACDTAKINSGDDGLTFFFIRYDFLVFSAGVLQEKAKKGRGVLGGKLAVKIGEKQRRRGKKPHRHWRNIRYERE